MDDLTDYWFLSTFHCNIAAKWAVTSPAIMKKKQKEKEKKEKKEKEKVAKAAGGKAGGGSSSVAKGKKRKKVVEEENDESSDHMNSDTDSPSPTKKKRRANTTPSQPPEIAQLTVYVHVRKNTPPTSSSRSKAKPVADEWLARDPFRFPADGSFDSFIQAIADILPCKLEAVPSAELTWKPRVPQNAKPLKVGGPVGFEGMVETFASKKDNSGRHVLLYMPPPVKPVEDLPVRHTLALPTTHTNDSS